MRKTLIITTLSLLGLSYSAYSRNLIKDYGQESYNLKIKIKDVLVSSKSQVKRENKDVRKSQGIYGKNFHIVAKTQNESNKNKKSYRKFRRGGLRVFASKNSDAMDVLKECRDISESLLHKKVDKRSDILFKAEGLSKLSLFQEPRKLRKSRYKIYRMRRHIRLVNRLLKRAKRYKKRRFKRRAKFAIRLLKKLKRKFVSRLNRLQKKRSKLLTKNLRWKQRHYVSVNLDRHEGSCRQVKANKKRKSLLKKIVRKVRRKVKKRRLALRR